MNVNSGIGVKLDNVTWIGAESVQNVIKVGVDFAAYGRQGGDVKHRPRPERFRPYLNVISYAHPS